MDGWSRMRCGASTIAVCALAGIAGAPGAGASTVDVSTSGDRSLFFYTGSPVPFESGLTSATGVGEEPNRVQITASGGVPGAPTTIQVRDRGAVIDPATALAAGCTVQSLHMVTCHTQSSFEIGWVYGLGEDDGIAIAEDSQLLNWEIDCGDGDDRLRAPTDNGHTHAYDCETIEPH